MASYFLAPDPLQSTQFIPGGNTPASGAQLFLYVAGSVSTKQTGYKDNLGSASWVNPIVLDSGGNLPNGGSLWFLSGQTYKAVLAPSNDLDPPNSPYWTRDNLAGINDTTGSQSEWISGPSPTFVSSTQFTLVGDQTPTFTIGRRARFTVTAGTVYGRITNSVFGVLTTVTMKMDGSTALDSGLSAVSYGLLSSKIKSEPERISNTNSTDTYSATFGITAYVVGDEFKANFTSTNTGTLPTLNADGLGAMNIKLQNGAAPQIGQLSGQQTLRITNTSTFALLNPIPTGVSVINGYLFGLTLLPGAVASGTMSTAAGVAADSGNTTMMTLSSATWKTATTWAVGTGNGGLLDGGPVSTSRWYSFYEIARPDTGVVDLGFSTTTPNLTVVLPTNYTLKRYIGSAKTSATTTWTAFTQDGDYFRWTVSVGEFSHVNPGTAASTRTFAGIPPGVNVQALTGIQVGGQAAGQNYALLSDLASTDEAPTGQISDLGGNQAAGGAFAGNAITRSNTSSQIRTRIFASDGGTTLSIQTFAYMDRRGRDA